MSSTNPILSALSLPDSARLDKRVPKKLLVERGAPTAADKRKIQEGIEEIRWVASLKPTNLSVPARSDEQVDYSEIAVLIIFFREKAKIQRLLELTHRAIPYPVAAIAEHNNRYLLSLAKKRRSEAEANQFVLEGPIDNTGYLDPTNPPTSNENFLNSLSISNQPRNNLEDFYTGWISCVLALQASKATGVYKSINGNEIKVRETLVARSTIENQISALKTQAIKEKQINRQVELNLKIKQLEKQLQTTTESL